MTTKHRQARLHFILDGKPIQASGNLTHTTQQQIRLEPPLLWQAPRTGHQITIK